MITVFTPAYNRAYTLGKLYESLCKQTSTDFEWLIVDDGSTDDTEKLIASFINENKMTIRYIKQPNGGKHRAINRGVKEASGELFFIVDSDDWLACNAMERIQYHYENIKGDASFAGVCGLRSYADGRRIGGEVDFKILDCSSLDFRMKYKIKGDMAEVFRTEILRKYPFPEIEGEYFCPEALVCNRIAQTYKLRYFYEKIYLCEYLPDGLTAKITKLRMSSSFTSMLYYSELYGMSIPFLQKMKAAINYWRFAFCSQKPFVKKFSAINKITVLLVPAAFFLYLSDRYKNKI